MNETSIKILNCSKTVNMVGSRSRKSKDALSFPGRILKRVFDFVASLIGIIVFSPFFVISFVYREISKLFFQIQVDYHRT